MKKNIFSIISILIVLFFGCGIAHAESGLEAEVKIFSGNKLAEMQSFSVLGGNKNVGGVNLSAGDFDGDGKVEIMVGSGVGDYPEVKIYNVEGKYIGKKFLPFHSDFRGGINVAAGDVNGDGVDELVFGQASLGEARIKIYQYNGDIIGDFLAYEAGIECGVNIATGDIDRDGRDEIITGAGRKGGPHVRIFDGRGRPTDYNFFPFHPDFRGGVAVDIGDVDGNGEMEIIASQAGEGQAWTKIYKKNGEIIAYDMLYPENIKSGIKVRLADINNDGQDEIITAAGYNGGPEIKYYKYYLKSLTYLGKRIMAFDENSRQGVNIDLVDVTGDGKFELLAGPGNIKPIKYENVDLNIPLIKQEKNLSCEAASLRMALAYKGLNVSEDELINLIGYDRTGKDGNIWGDPQYGFVGRITGRQVSSGYGVYWRPVAKAASMMRESYYFEGTSLKKMLEEVADGNPVIMWGARSNDFRPVYWRTVFGREIFAIIGQHARVVKGFIGSIDDPSHILANDPVGEIKTYTKEEFLENWSYFNHSGVVVK